MSASSGLCGSCWCLASGKPQWKSVQSSLQLPEWADEGAEQARGTVESQPAKPLAPACLAWGCASGTQQSCSHAEMGKGARDWQLFLCSTVVTEVPTHVPSPGLGAQFSVSQGAWGFEMVAQTLKCTCVWGRSVVAAEGAPRSPGSPICLSSSTSLPLPCSSLMDAFLPGCSGLSWPGRFPPHFPRMCSFSLDPCRSSFFPSPGAWLRCNHKQACSSVLPNALPGALHPQPGWGEGQRAGAGLPLGHPAPAAFASVTGHQHLE